MGGVNAHGYRKKVKVTEVYSKNELGKSNTTAMTIEERDSRVSDFRDSCNVGPKNDTMKKPKPAGTMHGMEVGNSRPGVLINELGMGHGKLHNQKRYLVKVRLLWVPSFLMWRNPCKRRAMFQKVRRAQLIQAQEKARGF